MNDRELIEPHSSNPQAARTIPNRIAGERRFDVARQHVRDLRQFVAVIGPALSRSAISSSRDCRWSVLASVVGDDQQLARAACW